MWLRCAALLCAAGFVQGSAWCQTGSYTKIPVENGRQVVTFWHYSGGDLRKPFEDITRHFNTIQDKYLVKPTYVPWNSSQKLLASVVAGAPPDVTMIDRPFFQEALE